ncbi:MAG TPA: ADOP family duplicated permease [Candidatus Angelobacter sp.]
MREVSRRLYYLLNRRRLKRELENDMEAHLEMMSADNRKDFGNPALLRERSHEAWGWGWLDRVFQDLRFGVRLLRKSPALAFTAIAVLALGIGVNVTAFNLVDVMFFKPLPVRDPHSLVRFSATSPTMSSTEVPYPAAMFYRDNSSALSTVLAQTSTTLTLSGETNEEVHVGLVSGNYFSELGPSAAYGRLFDPKTDEAPDAAPVVVLGYRYWQNHFAGDATVVGRTIRLNQHPATVIGVTAFDFSGLDPDNAEENGVWLMLSRLNYFVPGNKLLTNFDINDDGVHMSGRLKPGTTIKAAEASLVPLSQELAQQHPGALPKDFSLVAKPGGYAENLDPADSGMLPMFGLFAALVLLILATACANLGNLLLGHAANREREISIRLSLGATRRRIVRQLMTENLLLALLGSAAGFFLSWNVSHPLLRWIGGQGVLDTAPDWRTSLFTLLIGILACVLFGLPPARQASRQSYRKSRARAIFMSTQVAASCVLLVVSALLVRALYHAYNSDPGFDYTRVITIDPQLYAHGYTPDKAVSYMRELESRLRQVPGVALAVLVTNPPLGTSASFQRAHGDVNVNVHFNQISPGFFATMAIPLLRGRDFTAADKDVAILSESCARALWPAKDPLQQTFESGPRKLPVIGLVGNARLTALRNGDDAIVYMPVEENRANTTYLLVRTSQAPQTLLGTVSDVARAADPALSPNVQLLSTIFYDRMGDSGKMAAIVGGMGGLALVLGIVGLYGVVAYSVSQRTREVGIRIALGASPAGLVRNMVSSFVRPIGLAIAAGLALAAGLSTVLREYLYGVSNWDPFSYAGAALLLAATAALAALIPARRALKVDPVVALRAE